MWIKFSFPIDHERWTLPVLLVLCMTFCRRTCNIILVSKDLFKQAIWVYSTYQNSWFFYEFHGGLLVYEVSLSRAVQELRWLLKWRRSIFNLEEIPCWIVLCLKIYGYDWSYFIRQQIWDSSLTKKSLALKTSLRTSTKNSWNV